MPTPMPSTGMTLTNSFEVRKRILKRQAVDPVVLAGLLQRRRHAARLVAQRVDAFDQHQSADGAEEDDVEQRDEQVELADAAQQGEDEDAGRRADDAADQQHHAELEVERAALAGAASAPEKDEAMTWLAPVATAIAGRDVVEDQQRRDQEAAADAEHARQEADRRAHRQQHEHVDGQFPLSGDRCPPVQSRNQLSAATAVAGVPVS